MEALLGMLSAMNAEKRGTSRKFASKSNRSRNLTTSAALLPKHCIASVVGALSYLPPAVVDDIDNEMTRTVKLSFSGCWGAGSAGFRWWGPGAPA